MPLGRRRSLVYAGGVVALSHCLGIVGDVRPRLATDDFSYRDSIHVVRGVLVDGSAVAAIPEPSSILTLAGLALCFGLAGWWRKRRRAA